MSLMSNVTALTDKDLALETKLSRLESEVDKLKAKVRLYTSDLAPRLKLIEFHFQFSLKQPLQQQQPILLQFLDFLLNANITNHSQISTGGYHTPLQEDKKSVTILTLIGHHVELLIGKALGGIASVPALGPRFQHHPPNIGTVELNALDGSAVLHQTWVKLLTQKFVLFIIVIIYNSLPSGRVRMKFLPHVMEKILISCLRPRG